MAFPTLDLLSDSLIESQRIAKNIKVQAQSLHDASESQNIKRARVLRFIELLGSGLARLTAIRDVPGIGVYAQSQFNDGTLDIAVEFNSLRTQLQSTIDWAAANFPQSGNYVLVDQLNTSGVVTPGVFTPAQTATLRTELLALIATIE